VTRGKCAFAQFAEPSGQNPKMELRKILRQKTDTVMFLTND
jgi:hypothetical protein